MSAHEKIETNIGLLIILVILVVSIGGLVEIVPLFFMKSTTQPVEGLNLTPLCSCPDGTSTSGKGATFATPR